MESGIFSQALGLLACAGVLVAIALVAVVALATGWRRGRRASTSNPVVQPPSAPPFESDEFGGVPTTGPVQAYERDYRADQVIGSSGFDAQSYDAGEDREQE